MSTSRQKKRSCPSSTPSCPRGPLFKMLAAQQTAHRPPTWLVHMRGTNFYPPSGGLPVPYRRLGELDVENGRLHFPTHIPSKPWSLPCVYPFLSLGCNLRFTSAALTSPRTYGASKRSSSGVGVSTVSHGIALRSRVIGRCNRNMPNQTSLIYHVFFGLFFFHGHNQLPTNRALFSATTHSTCNLPPPPSPPGHNGSCENYLERVQNCAKCFVRVGSPVSSKVDVGRKTVTNTQTSRGLPEGEEARGRGGGRKQASRHRHRHCVPPPSVLQHARPCQERSIESCCLSQANHRGKKKRAPKRKKKTTQKERSPERKHLNRGHEYFTSMSQLRRERPRARPVTFCSTQQAVCVPVQRAAEHNNSAVACTRTSLIGCGSGAGRASLKRNTAAGTAAARVPRLLRYSAHSSIARARAHTHNRALFYAVVVRRWRFASRRDNPLLRLATILRLRACRLALFCTILASSSFCS